MKKLILASASPRRKDLLTEYGFNFEIKVCDAEEILKDGSKVVQNGKVVASYVEDNFAHIKDISGQIENHANLLKEVSVEQHSAMEASKRQVEVIREMMAGYQNMANSIQQQSNNLNCQIENLACRMEQFQVKAR